MNVKSMNSPSIDLKCSIAASISVASPHYVPPWRKHRVWHMRVYSFKHRQRCWLQVVSVVRDALSSTRMTLLVCVDLSEWPRESSTLAYFADWSLGSTDDLWTMSVNCSVALPIPSVPRRFNSKIVSRLQVVCVCAVGRTDVPNSP